MDLTFRNVNDAFRTLVHLFSTEGRCMDLGHSFTRSPSRNGDVILIQEPVTLVYTRPRERVLFNAARDCNPFALLYESLWMLAGRNDVAPLAYYTKQFLQYSDDGKTLNGAYGYRWRNKITLQSRPVQSIDGYCQGGWYGERFDQLNLLVTHLKADPNSRRAVLSMWNVEDDLLKIGPGEDMSRDVCCNLNVMFNIRRYTRSAQGVGLPDAIDSYLDMAVTNRSNDLVWGLLGANYVTFSILQEYMAAHLGVSVGRYHHFTNNLHAYSWNFKPEEWLEDEFGYQALAGYPQPQYSLILDTVAFDVEVGLLVESFKGEVRGPRREVDQLTEPFLRKVAAPMFRAYELHRLYKETEQAVRMCGLIEADDWRIVCEGWLQRRRK